jgi:hypothetical protein
MANIINSPLANVIQELTALETRAWNAVRASPDDSYAKGTHAGEATAYNHAISLIRDAINTTVTKE